MNKLEALQALKKLYSFEISLSYLQWAEQDEYYENDKVSIRYTANDIGNEFSITLK